MGDRLSLRLEDFLSEGRRRGAGGQALETACASLLKHLLRSEGRWIRGGAVSSAEPSIMP